MNTHKEHAESTIDDLLTELALLAKNVDEREEELTAEVLRMHADVRKLEHDFVVAVVEEEKLERSVTEEMDTLLLERADDLA